MDKFTRRTVLLESFRPYRFDELALLLASGMHDSEEGRTAAAINIKNDLIRRVDEGSLIVRNPLDLSRHTLPIGAALRRAVLFPWEVKPLLEERGISFVEIEERSGPELWTLQTAADSLGFQEGWHKGTVDTFKTRLVEAARAKQLVIRDPQTNLPHLPETIRDYWDLVMPADVNAWLSMQNVKYRWLPDTLTGPSDKELDSTPSTPSTQEGIVPELRMKERNTLLLMIAALCKDIGIEPHERGTAADVVRMTEKLGCPVGHDTVKKHLDAIPRAVQDRAKQQ